MAFVVEDGTGKSDATSYLSEAAADAYFADHGNPVAWTGADSATKQTALQMATQYLDSVYGQKWLGSRAVREQALDWPRFSVLDRDGFEVGQDDVPTAVEHAAAELARRHISETDGLMPDVTNPGGIEMTKDELGSLKTTVKYSGAASQVKQFRIVEMLIRELVAPGGRVDRG